MRARLQAARQLLSEEIHRLEARHTTDPKHDSFTVRGEGYSRLEAYRDLLSELVVYSYEQCNNDAEIELFWKRIREAMEAVSGR